MDQPYCGTSDVVDYNLIQQACPSGTADNIAVRTAWQW